jgi:hypothetical protein
MAGVVTVEGWPQRGGPTSEDQLELSERLSPLSAMLDWSVEPFSIQAGDGDGSLWVVTEVGEGEAGWRDLCQCLALGRRLSRLRPGWRWQLTDDSRQMEQRFKVCELGLKDGRIQRLAGWAAVDDGELEAQVEAALEAALGEDLRWIRRGEPPEEQEVETESDTDPGSETVEVHDPEVQEAEPDPVEDEPTEPDHPTVLETEQEGESWVALEFVNSEDTPPETVVHRPAEQGPVPPGFNPGAAAAEGLELLGAIQRLRGLIQHPDPSVRRDAVEAVGAMAGPAIALTLRPMLADPDEGVREAARAALLLLLRG